MRKAETRAGADLSGGPAIVRMTGAAEVIGWGAALVLLLTIGRQVYTQWRNHTTQGVSKWLFVGQLVASAGFVIYSYLLQNWVFVVTNLCMIATSALGQWIYTSTKAQEERR